MKKRWIVSAAALSAAALAVTGCGASASDSSASGNSGDSAASGDAGELYVYNWGEYIDETVIDEFEEETGIKVVYLLFGFARRHALDFSRSPNKGNGSE